MNETDANPAPGQPEVPVPDAQLETSAARPAESRRHDLLPIIGAIGFIILAAGLAYVWSDMVPASQLAAANGRINRLDSQLNQLSQNQSVVTPGEFAKLTARVDALDGRLASQAQLASRLDAASGRIEALSARVEGVSSQEKAALDNVSSQQKAAADALAAQQKSALDAIKQQMAAMASQVTAAQAAASNVQGFSQRLTRLAGIQEAALALSSGHPVGNIPGAPPALSRYAQTPPPTDAQLKQSYPGAQAQALAAQPPDDASAPLGERMWERAQGLITVRRGDQVVVGDTTAIALNQAKADLDAGDLPGAVKALETLKGAPARAMAEWLANAKGLVDARAALAGMAEQA
jgi:hypothetical protein